MLKCVESTKSVSTKFQAMQQR